MNQVEVIEKVKKLLALANGAGASEGERENAMRMATRLLARFNLDVADVSAVAEERIRQAYAYGDENPDWGRYVYSGIGRLFYCFSYRARDEKAYYLIGKPVNVTTASLMAEYVIANIMREAKDRAGRAKLDALFSVQSEDNGRGKAWENDFCLGAAMAVREKADELRKREEALNAADNADRGNGTAVTLAGFWEQEDAKNKALMAAMGITLTTKGSHIKDASALAAGQRHGSTISLNRQVGAGPQNLRLGSK